MEKHTIIGFGISILFICLVMEAVNTFVPPPQWKNYESAYAKKDTQTDNKEIADQKLKEYNKAQKKWAPYAFALSSVMGILALLVGATRIKNPGISLGLMGGGTLTIIGGYFPAQMSEIESLWKFLYLFFILGLFFWLGSRKLKEDL